MDSELLTKCSCTSLYTQWRTAEDHISKDVWLLCVTLNNTKRPLFLCMWQKNILLAVNFFSQACIQSARKIHLEWESKRE